MRKRVLAAISYTKGVDTLKRQTVVAALVGLVVVLAATGARAQQAQPTGQDKDLAKKVETLEKQVAGLKKEGAAKPAGGKTDKKPEGTTLRASWNNGLFFGDEAGKVKVQIGALIQDDWAAIDHKGAATAGTRGGTEFRRARLSISGSVAKNVEFKAEYDFANGAGTTAFKDVWVGLKRIPYVGNIRIGHYKEPFSLEEVTSDPWCTFMERALPNAFSPSRNVGLMLQNACLDDRLTWAAGLFHNADDFGVGLGQNIDFTGRIAGLPYAEAEDKLVHLGLGLSFRNPQDDSIKYSARPEAHLAGRIVDTGALAANSAVLIGSEAAMVYGPGSVQAEWVMSSVDQAAGPVLNFSGYYAQASYFVTGEHRVYKRATGAFDRPKPRRNFLEGKGGIGAWELALRYSHIDLNDATVTGGQLSDLTLGVNWYLNPVVRCSLNYVMADGNPAPDEHILEVRTQLSF